MDDETRVAVAIYREIAKEEADPVPADLVLTLSGEDFFMQIDCRKLAQVAISELKAEDPIKAAYREGWNDREADLLAGAARVLPGNAEG